MKYIVFGDSAYGCLKAALSMMNRSDEIININEHLNYGDITNITLSEEKNLNGDVTVLLSNYSLDQVALRYLATLDLNISVIYQDVLSFAALSPSSIKSILEENNEVLLSTLEKEKLSYEWKELVRVNSYYRIAENKNIKCENIDYFDKEVLENISETPTKLLRVVGMILCENNISDEPIIERIVHLIKEGKIRYLGNIEDVYSIFVFK